MLFLSGTELECLKVIRRIMYHLPVPTGERWVAMLKKNRGMSDRF